MKHLQKLFFALAVLAVSITGCNKVIDVPLTVDLGIKAITVKTGTQAIPAAKGADGVYTAVITAQQAEITVVPSDKTVNVAIEGKNGTAASVTFTGDETVKTIKIAVSKAGKTAVYTLKITYTPQPNAEIKTVTAVYDTDKSLTAVKTGETVYNLRIPATKARITVTPKDPKAAVSIDGTKTDTKEVTFSAFGETKKISITVTSGNISRSYTLTVSSYDKAAEELVPELKTLTVAVKGAPVEMTPAFKPHIKKYTVQIPADADAVTITAGAVEGIEVTGAQKYPLTEGTKIITVTAAVKGIPEKNVGYTITVNKAPDSASSQANLKTLTLLPLWYELYNSDYYFSWDKNFTGAETAYTYTTLGKFDGLRIAAVPEDNHATMTVSLDGSGAAPLPATDYPVKIGEQKDYTVTITVTAPDNTTKKTYTIQVKKLQLNFSLKKLTAEGMDVAFDPKESSKLYQVKAPHTLTQTAITAEAAYPDYMDVYIKVGSGAEKKVTGPETVPLNTGLNAILVTVKAKDPRITPSSGENVYRLHITRAQPGAADSALKNLSVSFHNGLKEVGLQLKETFSPEKTDYTVELSPYITNLRIEATPQDSKAGIQGWGSSHKNEFEVKEDGQVIAVQVVAQNGETKTYTITIRRLPALEIKAPAIPDSLNIGPLSGGYTVNGTFTDPENRIHEIWVGSSALPIQMKYQKWAKAEITGTGFTANFEKITELGNGKRDIRIIAYDTLGRPVAQLRKEVTILGSPRTNYSVNVNLISPSIREYTLEVFVYDAKYKDDYETVLVGYYKKKSENFFDDVQSLRSVFVPQVMREDGREYFVEVVVTTESKRKYTGSSERSQIRFNGSSFDVTLNEVR